MSSLGRAVFVLMIPLNVLLVLWVWVGRLFLDAGGWFMVLMVAALPFLALGLLATTVLAFRGSDRPHALTGAQTFFHLAMWLGMLGFGFFLVDFGDTDDSERSVFTNLVGRSSMSLSNTLTTVSLVVAVGAWVILLGLLIAQRRRHRSGALVPA